MEIRAARYERAGWRFESFRLRQFFFRGDECKASRDQFFKLTLAGSSPAFPAKTFRGRLIGRTLGSEPGNKGSTPFPEAKLITNRAFHRG
jgi:hypothetical protein